jgi:acyl carrier protein
VPVAEKSSVQADRLKSEILAILENEVVPRYRRGEIEKCDHLVQSGLLDSVGLVKLIYILEERYGVKIDLARFDENDFQSIDSIVARLEAGHS